MRFQASIGQDTKARRGRQLHALAALCLCHSPAEHGPPWHTWAAPPAIFCPPIESGSLPCCRCCSCCRQIPLFNRTEIDLFKLFKLVMNAGGLEAVSAGSALGAWEQPCEPHGSHASPCTPM